MKVYIKREEHPLQHPEDMQKILDYLKEHGEIKVSPKAIERLYEEFSEDMYSAGWMSINDYLLEEFSDWLNDYDM